MHLNIKNKKSFQILLKILTDQLKNRFKVWLAMLFMTKKYFVKTSGITSIKLIRRFNTKQKIPLLDCIISFKLERKAKVQSIKRYLIMLIRQNSMQNNN
jgi:23S rRNA G2445 N2-methylase RlmL